MKHIQGKTEDIATRNVGTPVQEMHYFSSTNLHRQKDFKINLKRESDLEICFERHHIRSKF